MGWRHKASARKTTKKVFLSFWGPGGGSWSGGKGRVGGGGVVRTTSRVRGFPGARPLQTLMILMSPFGVLSFTIPPRTLQQSQKPTARSWTRTLNPNPSTRLKDLHALARRRGFRSRLLPRALAAVRKLGRSVEKGSHLQS